MPKLHGIVYYELGFMAGYGAENNNSPHDELLRIRENRFYTIFFSGSLELLEQSEKR
jgi:hypothetical protein